ISGFCLLVVASTVNAQVPATNKILKKTDSVSLIPNNTLTPGAQQGAMKLNPQATTLTDTSGLTVASTDSLGLNEDVPFSFANPQHYVIAAVRVTGSNYLDPSLIASVTGIYRGEKIVLPGDQLSDAIKKLWSQQLFANVAILIDKIQGDKIYLNIHVTERPRLAHFYFKGVSRTQASELKDKVSLTQNSVITGNTTLSTITTIEDYFAKKGYSNASVNILSEPNEHTSNTVDLTFVVHKGDKVKVNNIYFAGNHSISSRNLVGEMEDTKERTRMSIYAAPDEKVYEKEKRMSFDDYFSNWGFFSFTKTRQFLKPYMRIKFFSSSKFKKDKLAADQQKVLDYYNAHGYRDAVIVADTVYPSIAGGVNVAMKIKEGDKYYYGDVSWKGNTQYSDSVLNNILGIQKGDVYNLKMLNEKLGLTPTQKVLDVSSLYQNNGYLFFKLTPVETSIYNDTIDYEMRMVEGPQADINRVSITGNTKTNGHVARRELRTIPGHKYSRQDVIRTMRQLRQLGFFDQTSIKPDIIPHPQDGTVDIGWNVKEKPADKLELSAGWGGYFGLTGTIGMSFNNFSLRNIFNWDAWKPLPTGDGQQLSVRLQSNGKYYSSFNVSFMEPWFGGTSRNPFSVSYYHNKFSSPTGYRGYIPIFNNDSYMKTTGFNISYGKQLHWPDDYFSLTFRLGLEQFKLKDYHRDPVFYRAGLSTGVSNNINVRITLDRNSTDRPDFPSRGSHFFLYAQLTPPYSMFDDKTNYDDLTAQEKFNFIEYQKYRFLGEWYFPLGQPHGKNNKTFVLKAAVKLGFVGRYNSKVPLSPFERFELGGDGMSNYAYYGKEIISQRGYPVYYTSDPTVNPENSNPPTGYEGFTIFNKYTLELRYPISLNPSSTIIALAFVEAANGYNGIKDYNPFELRRSVGLGMRFKLPMFGLLGFDYGLGIDRLRKGAGLKDATKFSFMLGYEPK
ncbi:MAG TPA: POTRA domain-containing protein, partial [Chitinophagaceae bacterium]|nr:POTRA domain-containing protein [Chitinophagaceae bacterium]